LQAFYPMLAMLVAYLLGSLSFAVIVSRVMGLSDPRTFGSKNPGATNVLRSGSKAAAVTTLLLDAAKGWLPVMWVANFGQAYGLGEGTQAMVGLAAFLGHLYPVFFRFVGGKGVATAAGVVLGVSGWLGLITLGVWLAMALVFRYSSLASITAALLAPVVYMLGDGSFWVKSNPVAVALVLMALLLLYRHTENVNRLVKGTESRLGKKSPPPNAPQAATHAHVKHGHRHPPARTHDKEAS